MPLNPKNYTLAMSEQLLTRNRLRLGNGKKVESTSDYFEYIEKTLLKQRPMTPKEISIILAKSTKQIHRYLNAMLDMKKIVKIEGSSKYKLFDSNATKSQVDLDRKIESLSEFFEAESVKRFMKKCTRKDKNSVASFIANFCMGVRIPEFRVHPDNFIHPESTELLISLERKRTNTQRLDAWFRIALRCWLENGLGFSLEGNSNDLRLMGLDGDKIKPEASRLEMKKSVYETVKKLITKEPIKLCKFGFRYWTFCRPSVMYIVKTNDLFFHDRIVKFIEVNGEQITDPKIIELLKDKFEVKQFSHRSCSIQNLKEYKTDDTFQKFILDEEIVKALEKFTDQRKKDGFKYLFWNDNNTEFTFENYDDIVLYEVRRDDVIFQKLFLDAGMKREEFGIKFRGNYSLRHFGVQFWLQKTDYDYGLIAKMGWKDITTLKDWYGGYTAEHFQNKIAGIIP